MCTRSEIDEYSISITKKHSQTEYSCDFYVSKWKVYFTSNFNFSLSLVNASLRVSVSHSHQACIIIYYYFM